MRRLMLVPVLIALMALLSACTPPPVASVDAEHMQWKTDGGGQIAFTINRDGSNYTVYVSSYAFEDRSDRFLITTDTGPVFAALSRVMQDQGKFHLNDSDAPTGSWTTLQFSDGEETITFDDVIVDGDLALIYDYIVAQITSTGE
jgi:hypothetical protein